MRHPPFAQDLARFLKPPFDIVAASWPTPIETNGERWVSDPCWEAPPMGVRPALHATVWNGLPRWELDWRAFFRDQFEPRPSHARGGQLRGFQALFRLRITQPGQLEFRSDDGCIIRRNGQIVFEDRSAHAPSGGTILVNDGDELEIALSQFGGDWTWAGGLIWPPIREPETEAVIGPFLPRMESRLKRPDGPALRVFTDARTPFLTILAVYSMVLNGYAPSEILLYGEHQWPDAGRAMLRQWLPFARVAPTDEIVAHLRELGGEELAEMALHHWFVMKACVALLIPPEESCFVDEDVMTLDSVDDALKALRSNDLVFSQEWDYGEQYSKVWRGFFPDYRSERTAKLSAGLLWLRQRYDKRQIALIMRAVPPESAAANLAPTPFGPNFWEQGIIAMAFAGHAVQPLPTQRYLFPPIDGLPGGITGYPYPANPCQFTTIHLCDTRSARPSNALALALCAEILPRKQAEVRPVTAPHAFRRLMPLLHTQSPYENFPISEYQPTFATWPTHEPIFRSLIAQRQPRRIIEVGSWLGASAVNMGRSCRELGAPCEEIICIDTWLGGADMVFSRIDEESAEPHPFVRSMARKHGYPQVYFTFLRNVIESGLQDLITPVPMPSAAAYWLLRQFHIKADLIYIDAAHEFDAVLDDLRKYWELLEPGGVLLGDDYDEVHLPGVRAAAQVFSDEVRRPLDVAAGKYILIKA